jgi:uncharacterized membrane protein YhaH (DUF805 family)
MTGITNEEAAAIGAWAAVTRALFQYVTIAGRARRAEFWWFIAFVALVFTGAEKLDAAIFQQSGSLFVILWVLALLPPTISVSVRRLHDLDRSGWWLLLQYIPFGLIILLVWFASRGTDGPNRFGADPLAASALDAITTPEMTTGDYAALGSVSAPGLADMFVSSRGVGENSRKASDHAPAHRVDQMVLLPVRDEASKREPD